MKKLCSTPTVPREGSCLSLFNLLCFVTFKGIVQRIYLIGAGEMEDRPFFFLNFKGTPSQEEHITVFFSGLKIIEMACLIKVTSRYFSVSGR